MINGNNQIMENIIIEIIIMEYYSAIKKNEIMPFAIMWMDQEITILSEISQTVKYKYYMVLLIWGI